LYSGAQIPRYKGFVKHSSAQEENAGPKVKHTLWYQLWYWSFWSAQPCGSLWVT